MTWCSQRDRSRLPEYLSWEGTKVQTQKASPAPTVCAKPVKTAAEMSGWSLDHAPITVRKKSFSFHSN